MTISTEVRKAGPFNGNGTASSFPFAFKVFKAEDMLVVWHQASSGIDATLTLTTDYTVSLNADQNASPGGTVTLVNGPLASGYTLVVSSDIPYLQPTDLTNQGGFYPKVITDALDRQTILTQQLEEQQSRSLALPITAPSNVSTELPFPEAVKLIGWDEAAEKLRNYSTGDIATAVAFGTAQADQFTGNGSTTAFTLTTSPGNINNLDVSVNGATQRPGFDYFWTSGTTITFAVAPPAPGVPGAKNILVRYMQGLATSDSALRAELLTGVAKIRDGEIALASIVSIVDFDGVDDFNGTTGTNNKDSFARAIAYLNSVGGGLLRLPRTLTGVYFINGDDTTPLASTVRLDPEPGVSIRLIYSGGAANSPLVNTALQATRQLPIYFANFGFTSFVGANVTRQLGETLPTVNNADGVYALPESLAGSAFKVIALASPNAAIAPVSSAADSIVFAGAGAARAAITPISAGDEVLALISSPTGGVFFAGVITVNGYAYVAQNSTDQTVKLVEGVTGLPSVLQGIPYAHTLNQQRDNFNNALVSVRVTSSRSFSVLVNGLVAHSYTTRSSIVAAAFGTENINDNISVSQMSRVRQGRTTGGAKALKILMVGDSITDNAVQYSHAKYLQMLLGSAGVSVAEINNIAVAGQTAAQQYAVLQTVGSGYDIACVQVGVNDVQGGTNLAAFTSTIVNIVNYCNNIGAAPIVAVPTAFYSQAEAIANGQNGGQNTVNNAALHTYRALLIRAVASAGGFLNMETMKGFGAMSAKWLSVAPYSVSDRIVVDNIHPSPYGSMMLAQGWARSIMGWLNRPDSTKAEAFETIASSWLSSGFGLIDKPTIRSRELKGILSLHATNNNDGAVAFVLPPAYQPDAVRIIPVVALNSSYLPVGPCSMYVGTNGNVYFFNLPAGTIKVQLDSATL